MLEDLEERERVLKKARTKRREEEVKRWANVERVKDEGKRMMEEREREIRIREEEAERSRIPVEEEDIPPTIGIQSVPVFRFSIDLYHCRRTRHNNPTKIYPHEPPTLTTPSSLKSLLSPFGPTDEALTFLSLKPPKNSQINQRSTPLPSFRSTGSGRVRCGLCQWEGGEGVEGG